MHTGSGARLRRAALVDVGDVADVRSCALRGLADVYEDGPDGSRFPRAGVLTIGDTSAGALRLTHRALEAHGDSLGYAIGVWIGRALECAGTELEQQALDDEAEIPVALNQARLATMALTRATAATVDDPMLVPVEAANGLGHLLAVYLIAIAAAT
jgi:hypothetical protein